MKKDQPWGTSTNPLAICVASDEAYSEGLLLTLVTALWSLPSQIHCELLILDTGLAESTRNHIEADVIAIGQQKKHTIRWDWRTPDLKSLEDLPPLRENNYSTYARLFLCEETELNSLLWIDSDILVFRNLLNVFGEIDGDPLIAGCVDTGVKVVGNETPVKELENSTLPYLNAGFLWLNLQKMRRLGFAEGIRDFITKYRETLRFHDQTALNSYIGDDRGILPGFNNYLCAPWYRDNSALLRDFPEKNLHYLGGDKPWMESQRLSCYTRNVVYHYTRKLMLGQCSAAGLARTQSLVSKDRFFQNLLGLARQLLFRETQGTEDRFQSIREFRRSLNGSYEAEIKEKLDYWYYSNSSSLIALPSPKQKPETALTA